jgi:hypothetical protein
VWLQGSLYGYSGLEMDKLQTLVSSTNELADTLRAVRPRAAQTACLMADAMCLGVSRQPKAPQGAISEAPLPGHAGAQPACAAERWYMAAGDGVMFTEYNLLLQLQIAFG